MESTGCCHQCTLPYRMGSARAWVASECTAAAINAPCPTRWNQHVHGWLLNAQAAAVIAPCSMQPSSRGFWAAASCMLTCDVPPMMSTGTPASSRACSTPKWASPREPPPDRTSPTALPAIQRPRRARSYKAGAHAKLTPRQCTANSPAAVRAYVHSKCFIPNSDTCCPSVTPH